MSSEVRNRKGNQPSKPEIKKEKPSEPKIKKEKGSSGFLSLSLVLILVLNGVFLYINHTQGGSLLQTAEKIKHKATEIFESLSQKIAQSKDFSNSGSQALVRLEEKNKNFDFSYQNGALVITSKNCETKPPTINQELKTLSLNIGQEMGDLQQLVVNPYICNGVDNDGLITFVNNIAGSLKNLKALSLDFRGAKGITDDGIEQISKVLGQSFQQLEDLQLNFTLHSPQANQLTDKSLGYVSEALGQNLKNLRRLSLNFAGARLISDAGVLKLLSAISSNLPQLKDLGLEFKWIGTFTNEVFVGLRKALGNLKLIEKLYVNFDANEKISNDGLIEFAKGLIPLNKLTHLVFSCHKCDKFNSVAFKEFFSGLASKKLEEFQVLLAGVSGFNDEVLLDLNRLLSDSFVTLKKLVLNLPSCRLISDKGLNQMADLVEKSLHNLVEFYFDFSNSDKATDEGVVKLISSLAKHATKLEKLSLQSDLVHGITDDSIIALADSFETQFKGLKQLSVGFSGNDKITNNGFTKFLSSMTKNLKLVDLTLGIAATKNVNDEGMINLANELSSGFNTLESLNLLFSSLTKVTDTGVNAVAKGLSHQKNLRKLFVSFFGSSSVGHEGVKNLCTNITDNLADLVELGITINGLTGVTDETIKVLATTIPKKLKKLEGVTFGFSVLSGVTDASLNRFSALFAKNAKNLRRITLQAHSRPKRPDHVRPALIEILSNIPSIEVIA